eukprot:CAMPEP_0174351688 /NCGR_PEP_ID=MMETSP0811_2-20130205/9106_1 /TAXON_ID=73025 ORGANISM="Eutreptiella gymnastica-like, Strain CCMP1594" /NCGR_SAMPLE_ID=MMETSP0811_2 /ASSEMBLY_ACC=CAM_ASM_000667 /LENGTH=141 /DNA_ID=CAMNT_0015481125 /DNA_START=475 /DNA_END=900 /DNA_ORIENTATION=+
MRHFTEAPQGRMQAAHAPQRGDGAVVWIVPVLVPTRPPANLPPGYPPLRPHWAWQNSCNTSTCIVDGVDVRIGFQTCIRPMGTAGCRAWNSKTAKPHKCITMAVQMPTAVGNETNHRGPGKCAGKRHGQKSGDVGKCTSDM